jgi:chemotaxis regulatin CheY-phosphate phosphatase CheZ
MTLPAPLTPLEYDCAAILDLMKHCEPTKDQIVQQCKLSVKRWRDARHELLSTRQIATLLCKPRNKYILLVPSLSKSRACG